MGDKILFLSASPIEAVPRLRTDAEFRAVEKAIRESSPGRYSIEFCVAAQRQDLQDALLRHRPRIVHFSGHGDTSSGIVLEDGQEHEAPVSGAALAELFAALPGTIRIVFLNACNSHTTAEAFHHLIDYSVAMRGRISDAAAIVFASAFYRALAYGKPPEDAFRLGISELKLEQIAETHIPKLLIRPGLLLSPAPAVDEDSSREPERQHVVNVRAPHTTVFTGDHPKQINNYGEKKS